MRNKKAYRSEDWSKDISRAAMGASNPPNWYEEEGMFSLAVNPFDFVDEYWFTEDQKAEVQRTFERWGKSLISTSKMIGKVKAPASREAMLKKASKDPTFRRNLILKLL